MKLSILTATYNRAKYLPKLYESIMKNQENSNINAEWIIIDDGSTDNTKQVIDNLIKKESRDLKIKYIFQKNQGKMAAINRGMKEVTGELIVDCDSDDFFAENAFYTIEKNASKLIQNSQLYALCFLKSNTQGKISGNKFKQNYYESTMFDLYFKENIQGEKILVFNAQIRKNFKHELEDGEKFITEARMYHKMDSEYKVLCINKPIEIGDYIEDGYTKNIASTFKNSPKGYYKYFKEILNKGLDGVKLKKKIYVIKHFLYFFINKSSWTRQGTGTLMNSFLKNYA